MRNVTNVDARTFLMESFLNMIRENTKKYNNNVTYAMNWFLMVICIYIKEVSIKIVEENNYTIILCFASLKLVI